MSGEHSTGHEQVRRRVDGWAGQGQAMGIGDGGVEVWTTDNDKDEG